jgi:hypothetical protein
MFDPISKTWNTPKIAGDRGVRKQGLTEIIDNIGKMYLFSKVLVKYYNYNYQI